MKYFTPELIARGKSNDNRVLNEVEAAWDDRCEQYGVYLDAVQGEFPPGLKHIEDSYYLHDATVLGMGRRNGTFVIVLQLDPPPESLLIFAYQLVESPGINADALPEAVRFKGDVVEWQYDEIEKVAGSPPTWRQSILLSNGWEVVLHFTDVAVEEMQAILPPSRNGAVAAAPAALPQSA